MDPDRLRVWGSLRLTGHQRARQHNDRSGQHQDHAPLPLGGGIHHGPKPGEHLFLAAGKPGGEAGEAPVPPGHLVQDGPAIGPASLLPLAVQQVVVTAQLHVPPGNPHHEPHQGVEPVDAPGQSHQEHVPGIPVLQMGQLMGQGPGEGLRRKLPGEQNGGADDPHQTGGLQPGDAEKAGRPPDLLLGAELRQLFSTPMDERKFAPPPPPPHPQIARRQEKQAHRQPRRPDPFPPEQDGPRAVDSLQAEQLEVVEMMLHLLVVRVPHLISGIAAEPAHHGALVSIREGVCLVCGHAVILRCRPLLHRLRYRDLQQGGPFPRSRQQGPEHREKEQDRRQHSPGTVPPTVCEMLGHQGTRSQKQENAHAPSQGDRHQRA